MYICVHIYYIYIEREIASSLVVGEGFQNLFEAFNYNCILVGLAIHELRKLLLHQMGGSLLTMMDF